MPASPTIFWPHLARNFLDSRTDIRNPFANDRLPSWTFEYPGSQKNCMLITKKNRINQYFPICYMPCYASIGAMLRAKRRSAVPRIVLLQEAWPRLSASLMNCHPWSPPLLAPRSPNLEALGQRQTACRDPHPMPSCNWAWNLDRRFLLQLVPHSR